MISKKIIAAGALIGLVGYSLLKRKKPTQSVEKLSRKHSHIRKGNQAEA